MRKNVVFALSLAANVVIFILYLSRPAVSPAPASAPLSPARTTAKAPTGFSAMQAAAIDSGDLAQMKAAGIPGDIAGYLSVGRAYARMQSRTQAIRKSMGTDEKYWQRSPFNFANQTKEQRAEMNKIQREFTDSLRTAFGDDASPYMNLDRSFSFLSATKRDQLKKIEQDYSDMQSEIWADGSRIQLPSDRQKLKLLQQEKDADIAASLSPAELQEYQLHASATAMNVRARYGEAIQSEEDYRKIFALQKSFDDQFQRPDMGGQSPEFAASRRAAELKLQDDIRSALGPDSYAAFQKSSDTDYKLLTSVTKRLNLADGTPDLILKSRDAYAAQSLQINQNTALSDQERRAQIKAVADQATAELQSKLGAEGAEAYAARANWLRILKAGNAFSTDPKNLPPGAIATSNAAFSVPPPRRPNG